MARLFESESQASSTGNCCPGEDDCQRFQSSEEPKLDACTLCPLLPTKLTRLLEALPPAEAEALLDEVERMGAEQRLGFAPLLASKSPLHFELLVLWGEFERMHERAAQARLPLLMEAWLKAMAKR